VDSDVGEFDIIAYIDCTQAGSQNWSRYQPAAFVECKNQKERVGQGDVSKLAGKIDTHRDGIGVRLAFMVSPSGFTSKARQQAHYRCIGNSLIVLLGPAEIEELLRAKEPIERELWRQVNRATVRAMCPIERD